MRCRAAAAFRRGTSPEDAVSRVADPDPAYNRAVSSA